MSAKGSTTSHQTQHRFCCEQVVEVENETYVGFVEIRRLLPGACKTHSAPMYGCSTRDKHFSFCEESLKILSPDNRRKMN